MNIKDAALLNEFYMIPVDNEKKTQHPKKLSRVKSVWRLVENWISPPSLSQQEKIKAAKKLIHYLSSQNDLYLTEGLFRIEGDAVEVDQLFRKIVQKESVLPEIFAQATQLPVLTTLLKKLFKEKELQLENESLEKFILIGSTENKNQQNSYAKAFFASLTEEKKKLYAKLFKLMDGIAKNARVNKMTPDNLAKSFAQNLLLTKTDDIVEFLTESGYGCDAFAFLIENRTKVFK